MTESVIPIITVNSARDHRGDLWESDGVEARDSNVSLERRGASASDMVRKRM